MSLSVPDSPIHRDQVTIEYTKGFSHRQTEHGTVNIVFQTQGAFSTFDFRQARQWEACCTIWEKEHRVNIVFCSLSCETKPYQAVDLMIEFLLKTYRASPAAASSDSDSTN